MPSAEEATSHYQTGVAARDVQRARMSSSLLGGCRWRTRYTPAVRLLLVQHVYICSKAGLVNTSSKAAVVQTCSKAAVTARGAVKGRAQQLVSIRRHTRRMLTYADVC